MARDKIGTDNKDRIKPGRPKGAVNKTTALLKDAILKAAEMAGDGDIALYLEEQARQNPGPFMALLGKVLPTQLAGNVAVQLEVLTRRIVDPKNG